MEKIKQFLSECRNELSKVVWPDKNERIGSTWVVLISVLILTVLVYVLDIVYNYAFTQILS
jgi:preprotein translocase subunit SecE